MHEKELGAVLPAPIRRLRKKKKRKMVDPCHDSGKKQEGALEENIKTPPVDGFLEFLPKWVREWISIIAMCRLRETECVGSERSRYTNRAQKLKGGREGH